MRRIDVLFVAFGIVIGCTTYDVVTPADDAGGVDASTGDASSDTASADGGFDVAVPDSPPPIDATGEKPPIDAAGCTCDCDKDGFRDVEGGPSLCTTTLAGDCDDLDPRAFPDAGFRADLPTADTKGDWNCDTHVTRRFNVLIDCAQYTALGGCSVVEGFASDPPCGTTATYVHCQNTAASCATGPTEMRTQECK